MTLPTIESHDLGWVEHYGPGLILALIVTIAWRVLLRAHRDESVQFNLLHLVVNRYGKPDLLACSFIALLLANLWVLAICTLRDQIPEGIAGLLAAVNGPLTTPLAMKVIFGAKAQPPDNQPGDKT